MEQSKLSWIFSELGLQKEEPVLREKLAQATGWLVIDGVDAGGKGTLINNIRTLLNEVRPMDSYMVVRYPGGTPQAEAIRQVLKTGEPEKLTPEESTRLFAVSRFLLYHGVIKHVKHNSLIVGDRWTASAFAYQGKGEGQSEKKIRQTNDFLCPGIPEPDAYFFLDVKDTSITFRRAKEAQEKAPHVDDRFIKFGEEFQRRVRDSYRQQARNFPDLCFPFDATGTMDDLLLNFASAFFPLLQQGRFDKPRNIEKQIAQNTFPGQRDYKIPDIVDADNLPIPENS